MSVIPLASLRGQLVRLTLAAVGFAILVTVGGLVLFEVTTYRPRALADARVQAELVATIIVPALEFEDAATAAKLLEILRKDPVVRSAAVYDRSGVMLAQYRREATSPAPPALNPPRDDLIDGDRIIVASDVKSEGNEIGRVWLEAALPGWNHRVQRYAWILFVVTAAITVLSLALAASVHREITDPLRRLAETARRVGRDHNLAVQMPETGPAEIGAMARSFNEMLAGLRERDHRVLEAESRLSRQNAGLAEIARMEPADGDGIESLLGGMAGMMRRVLRVDRVSIWLWEEDRGALRCMAAAGGDGKLAPGARLLRSQFPRYFEALEHDRVIDAADLAADPRTSEFADTDFGLPGPGAVLDVPIRRRGLLAGVICCEHGGAVRPWPADEIAFASATGDHVALLLEQEESRRAYRNLRESEDRFRNFIDQARDAIFTLSTDGRIESVNPAANRLTGWDLSTWIGHRFQRVLLPEDLPLAERNFAAAIAGANPPPFELRIRSRTGGIVIFEFALSALLTNGQVTGLLGIGRDVTERRQAAEARARLEGQLRQSQKMEAVGTLAGGIAHDFNNILTAIIGNATLAESDLPRTDPAREFVSQVLLAAGRAKELVRQILLFSRRQEQRRQPLVIAEVVREAMKLLRPVLPSSIEIRLALDEALPPVNADAAQLHQVIVNLATNAAQAMEEHGGVLEMSLATESITLEQVGGRPHARPGRFVRLTVRDDGVGMNEETQQRLFEPFFTTKEPGKGTGLGLAVVHGVMQQHEGFIEVASTLGKGTRFDLFFPVSTASTTPAENRAVMPIPAIGQQELILVVDDEPMVLSVARQVLIRANYRVVTCATPEEAQEKFQAAPGDFHLVITDLTMPRLKGTRLAAGFRELRPDVPIIIMTGFNSGLAPEAMRISGLAGPLQKPFTSESLLALVSDTLRRPPRVGG